MLYTSGTTGRPKGVHKGRGDPRADLDVGLLTQYDPDRHVHLLTGPLYHARRSRSRGRRRPRSACRS